MVRELADARIVEQAEAFLDFETRSGLPRSEAWHLWSASKDFDEQDESAIRAEVQRRRVEGALDRGHRRGGWEPAA